ncbi:SCO family protein [Brevibacillus nitrificans]|uniref:SCO family protein n=1 Tax=Brevibacillus nitrificans TaxID=651560 RepID=A0A3M8D031_9BACL|nr:SCO family protein [Brevibacillus nitrificans]RNB81424.1 SCO family protein [Brevibacillus nitrificans]
MSGEAQQQQGGALQRHWFTVLAGVLILAIVGVFGYNYMTKEQIPVMKALNDFSLDNINGSTYTFSEGKGKVRLVEFMFTNCPDICPATTYNMSKLQDQLKEKGLFGDKVEFVSITFDPDFDTPEVLQAYAEKFKADQSGWKFLRGDAQAIEKVTKDFGVAVMKQPDGSFAHTARMFLVDEDGNMRRAYGMAAEMDMDQMMKEMVELAD